MNPINQTGRQYSVAKHAQITINPATTDPATIARIAGAQAPHHGQSTVRLNANVPLCG
jgi:hypothetical protein